MAVIGIRELKERTSEILRQVREKGEAVEISHRGKVVARIVPVKPRRLPASTRARVRAVWEEIDRVAEEISARWPKGVSAVRAVREQRRG
jgi:prevent-host-death family protein